MPNKWSVLFITLLGSFLMPFMGSSINIALPSIGNEFNIDAIVLSWVTLSFLLSVGIFLVPFGRIADIHGRKKVFTYGMIIYTLGSLFASIAKTPTVLIGSRILQGMGGAMFSATCIAIITSVFLKEERGKMLGINVASVYIGLSLGPFIGGIITQHLGWRYLFILNIPLCLFIIALVFWKLKGDWIEAKGESFDMVGSLIYGLILITLMMGFSSLPAINGYGLIIVSILGLWLFIMRETRIANPVLNINIFRGNPVFIFSNLAALINYCATTGVGFLLSLYLQYIKNLTPQQAGLVLVAQPVIMAIFSPFAGRLSDRIEPRIVSSLGMALTTLGLFLISLINFDVSLGFIVLCLIILGSGFALFSSPNTNAIMSSVDKRFFGVASATLGTMRLVGNVCGLGIITLMFALYLGKVEITPKNYSQFLSSVRALFLIFAIICFAGIFASLSRGRLRTSC